jgi:hypothetical protein
MKALYRLRLPSWALLIFVAGAAYGCDEFLVANPQGALDEGTLANQTGVEGNLIATYRLLDHVYGAWGTAASNWVWGSATSDDAYKGSEASDQPPITDIEMYIWTTGGADDYLNDRWSQTFEAFVRANATLKLMAKVLEADPEAISQADQNGIRGEALFLRILASKPGGCGRISPTSSRMTRPSTNPMMARAVPSSDTSWPISTKPSACSSRPQGTGRLAEQRRGLPRPTKAGCRSMPRTMPGQ